MYYNYKDSYRGMDYYDARERPAFSFGGGLTYTTFSYCLLAAPADAEAEKVETLTVSASITNTGLRAASAVPQLYLHRAQGVVTSRVRALCDFQKLCLAPGETQTVTLSIPREALSQWESQMRRGAPRQNPMASWASAARLIFLVMHLSLRPFPGIVTSRLTEEVPQDLTYHEHQGFLALLRIRDRSQKVGSGQYMHEYSLRG